MIDRVTKALDNKKGSERCLGGFMDLSKASDTLDHSILISKLEYYGLGDNSVNLILSYLANRKQYISLNGHDSSLLNITTGLPQGSILGPLLFIIYLNDLCTISPYLDFICYADDTTLLFNLDRLLDDPLDFEINDFINEELKKVETWLAVNKLSLNVQKTKYIIFRKGGREYALDIKINNQPVERVHSFNFLGLIISYNLKWDEHIDRLKNKLTQTTGMLHRIKKTLPASIMKTIYDSLFLSRITFHILSWGSEHSRLKIVQKKAIRAICKKHYVHHTVPLFAKLKTLTVADLYKLNLSKFYHKLKRFELPNYFHTNFLVSCFLFLVSD